MRHQLSSSWILTACAVLALAGSQAAALVSSECSFQRTLQVNGPVNLDVTTGAGNIQVSPGASNQVQVCGHVKASNWFGGSVEVDEDKVKQIENHPPILQSGNDIRIGHIDDPELRRHISISYEVVVPLETRLQSHTGSGGQEVEGIQGPVEIGSGSGNLHASDVGGAVRAETGSGGIALEHIKGNVRAKTGSGSIRASDIAGGFEASTGSGHINLEQTAPGSVRVDTGSGGMELRGVRGSLEAKTGSGSIQADGDPTGAWTLHTGSGGVHLRFPTEASFDLDARTGSGSVAVNHPVTVQGSIGHKEIHGKVRSGGVAVNVETGSGSIEID